METEEGAFIRIGIHISFAVLASTVIRNEFTDGARSHRHNPGLDFDQPSSLFGQFQNNTVTEVAVALDTKLEKVIETAAQLAGLQQGER